MKRALITLMAVAMMAIPTFGFMSFGYLHGVPDNDGTAFIGFDFGAAETGEFNVQAYLGDLWEVDGGAFIGLRAWYEVDAAWADLEVGGFIGSTPLDAWPSVGTGEAGLFIDAVFHLLPISCAPPQTCGNISLDLITNFDLEIDAITGLWLFGGEIGFEVKI